MPDINSLLPTDLGGESYAGPLRKLPWGFLVPGQPDYAAAGTVLVKTDGTPLISAVTANADGASNTRDQIPADARIEVFNGTGWDRARSVAANADPGNVTGIPGVHGLLSTGTGFDRQLTASAVGDGNSGANSPAVMPMMWDGTTWVKQRTHTSQTLLTSATRVGTTGSGTFNTYGARVAIAVLWITAASGTGGVRIMWRGIEPVTGTSENISTAPAFITTTGIIYYLLGDVESTPSNHYATASICNFPVPDRLFINVLHGDGTNYTYSLGIILLR